MCIGIQEYWEISIEDIDVQVQYTSAAQFFISVSQILSCFHSSLCSFGADYQYLTLLWIKLEGEKLELEGNQFTI